MTKQGPSAAVMQELTVWALERLENCHEIAAVKSGGTDRDGWLEDAKHYETVLQVVAELIWRRRDVSVPHE